MPEHTVEPRPGFKVAWIIGRDSRVLGLYVWFARLGTGCCRTDRHAKITTVVGVAQLVERRSVAPNVAGSIPVSHPNTKKPNKNA